MFLKWERLQSLMLIVQIMRMKMFLYTLYTRSKPVLVHNTEDKDYFKLFVQSGANVVNMPDHYIIFKLPIGSLGHYVNLKQYCLP